MATEQMITERLRREYARQERELECKLADTKTQQEREELGATLAALSEMRAEFEEQVKSQAHDDDE